jgi:cytoskeletal protein RodZ
MLVPKNKYPVKKNYGRRGLRKKPLLFTFGVIVMAAIVLAALELTNTTHLLHKSKPASEVIVKNGKSMPAPKNNSSASSSTSKTPGSSNRTISGGTDTNGSTSSSTSSNQWTISASGDITVKQPTANAKLQSGTVLSGSAKVPKVNFRLIDDSVGVISEGSFNVVNGNFSGTLNFTPQASTGRLDVFSTNDQGVELNEVQISVRF